MAETRRRHFLRLFGFSSTKWKGEEKSLVHQTLEIRSGERKRALAQEKTGGSNVT